MIIVLGNIVYAAKVATLSGSYNTSGYAQGITIAGDYVYVADGSIGVKIIKISDKTSPILVGNYGPLDTVRDITVRGDYAYIASHRDGLQIINISNPTQPTLVGGDSFSYVQYVDSITVRGNYAYMSNSNQGLRIMDISDPSSPYFVSEVRNNDRQNYYRDVFLLGKYIYVCNGKYGLTIIDISDPINPIIVGDIDTPGIARGVFVVGSYAYVADNKEGLQIIDISNPKKPVLVGNYQAQEFMVAVSVVGNYAYVADGLTGLQVINIANPRNPILDTSYVGLRPSDLTVLGDYVYLVEQSKSSGLKIINVQDSTAIEVFVARFYTTILGRNPDTNGLNDWATKLKNLTKTGADIARGFIFSPEYDVSSKGDFQYLETLYSAFFNRAPDEGGLDNWLIKILDGASREDVLDGFLYSEEFNNLCNAYGIKATSDSVGTGNNNVKVQAFVERFYIEVLDRTADTAGLADWVNRLTSSASSASDIAKGFILSNEFVESDYDNATYVTILYRAFFGREPDTGGFKGWMSELSSGISREAVLEGFLGAPEFANLAAEYEIRVN
jgi:hypothetical protein